MLAWAVEEPADAVYVRSAMRVIAAPLAFCLWCLAAAPARGQQTELDTLNALFAGSAAFRLDRGQYLVIDLWDAVGRYRQETVELAAIEAGAVAFSLEADAILLSCSDEAGRCFRGELFRQGAVRHSSRCALPRPAHDPAGAAATAALRALIAAGSRDARQAQALETRTPPHR